ncbi:MAG: DUF971 domain-containing protein [Planctomycetaceae bacterium]|nr:hypothetical protein [Planctomycetaceae bacterium]|tara:strand:- start:411 stop:731 length:321 start_codon:yes stop_codon:yes gene_type:complete
MMAESPMVPTAINRHDPEKLLQVVWPDGVDKFVPYREVRLACHCAHCVDEWTGKPLLDPESVPMDVSIKSMELKGNYAVKITWTDGHDTGLYSWTRLSSITRPGKA